MTHHGERKSVKQRSKGLVVACALFAVFVLLLLWDQRYRNWQSPPGVIQATRVVVDHVAERKTGAQIIWRAEYRVTYSVADHAYAVWADSGVRGQNEDDVRMVSPPPEARCRVQYDPGAPASSIADCR
jgi:hypothetical protein